MRESGLGMLCCYQNTLIIVLMYQDDFKSIESELSYYILLIDHIQNLLMVDGWLN